MKLEYFPPLDEMLKSYKYKYMNRNAANQNIVHSQCSLFSDPISMEMGPMVPSCFNALMI